MINPSLRRAVLAAFAVASLSLPAAAQTDAAFASTLGKLPSGLATMAQLKTQSQVPPAAQVQGPTVPADVWRKVFQTALRYGKREAVPNTPGFSYTRQETFTTPRGRQVSQAFNFLVVPLANGQVRAVAAQFVRIETIYDTKTKQGRLEAVFVETDGAGKLENAFYRTDTFVSDAPATEGTPVAMDLADPDTLGGFTKMLEWWVRD